VYLSLLIDPTKFITSSPPTSDYIFCGAPPLCARLDASGAIPRVRQRPMQGDHGRLTLQLLQYSILASKNRAPRLAQNSTEHSLCCGHDQASLRASACFFANTSQLTASSNQLAVARHVSDLQRQFSSSTPGQPLRPKPEPFCCKLLDAVGFRDSADRCKCPAGEAATAARPRSPPCHQTYPENMERP
jgi:hypothetical protein